MKFKLVYVHGELADKSFDHLFLLLGELFQWYPVISIRSTITGYLLFDDTSNSHFASIEVIP